MSLPFFTSFARNSQSVTGRRLQTKGQSIGSTAPLRRSVDAASSRKRGAAHLLSGLDDDVEPCLETCGEFADHDEKPCTTSRLKVGVLGLGNVGRSVAICLAAKPGLVELAVYNRRSQPIEPFRLIPGVRVKASAADICSWADVVIVCMSTYEAAASVLGSPEALRALKGCVVVQLTHGTPQQAVDAAAATLRAKGAYLDACLLGSPDDLGSAGTCIIASGGRSAWDRSEKVLKLIAPKSFWCGDQPALANAANVALFSFLASCYMGYIHAMRLGQRFGMPENVLPTLISGGMIPLLQEVIQSGTVSVMPNKTSSSSSTPGASNAVGAAQKMGSEEWFRELEQCRQVSAEAGVSTAALDGVLAWAREHTTGGQLAVAAHATTSAVTHRDSSSGCVPMLQNPHMESWIDKTDSTPLCMDMDKKVSSPMAVETSGEDVEHYSEEANRIVAVSRDVFTGSDFNEGVIHNLLSELELWPLDVDSGSPSYARP